MTVEVTLQLPEQLVRHAKRFGEATHRDTGQVLADTLAWVWDMLETIPEHTAPVSTLSDEEVLAWADVKMAPSYDARLGELQGRGKECGLTDVERTELLFLLRMYQVGQLRKSEGLAEAVRRGLHMPLPV